MSKKKNTLKDLDEFLKQQAASLVSPEKLNVKTEDVEPELPAQPEPAPEEPVLQKVAGPVSEKTESLSYIELVEQLRQITQKDPDFRKKLFDLIIKVMEAQHHQIPEDKILINTALYLKHGAQWKEAIRSYWQHHE